MPYENHPDGFIKFRRNPIGKRLTAERVKDYGEIWNPTWDARQLRDQGARCMDCGVPTCMAGCPIGNIIPDWNDLVYRADWREALARLHATNNFPEFTGYTCPAPCEDACTLAYNDDAVTIKDIERAISDRGWEEGWIVPEPPPQRTRFRIAVVGSGPAGLSAAQQLNRAGHRVTVFERDDVIGGLMIYGIPDFKFAKERVARRVEQLTKEGIEFRTNANVGTDIAIADLIDEYDAVCLGVGAQRHRDVRIPGRELKGIYFGMPYLIRENRRQLGQAVDDVMDARGKEVVVLGGGDTGADCVATAHRQGAKKVTQISIRQQAPFDRTDDNPWPMQLRTYLQTYAQEEGAEEQFALDTVKFLDDNGDGAVDEILAERVEWTFDERGQRLSKTVLEENIRIPADMILVAIGFAGAEDDPFRAYGFVMRENGTFAIDDNLMTNIDGVFACGDANIGASLVVWAIGEGRDAARAIDLYLQGTSDLPPSLRTHNPPLYP